MLSSLPALLLSSPKHINSNGSLSGAFSVLLSASNTFSLSLFLCSSQRQYLSVISLVLWESLIGLCLCTCLLHEFVASSGMENDIGKCGDATLVASRPGLFYKDI